MTLTRTLVGVDRPRTLAAIGPNWFASVMGTGIMAIALNSLPVDVPGRRPVAILLWLLAAWWLVVLGTGFVAGRVRFRPHDDVGMTQFWGAPAMGLMTVGAGALLVGRDVIGLENALRLDWTLWTAGTLLGLGTAMWIPFRMMTTHDVPPGSAFGGWLMPVVPPMVSAANGALLIPHLPPGQARLTMLLACYAMFGISLFATVIVVPQIWQRLVHHKLGPAAAVPTVWIVLGPLGQSITASDLLAGQAGHVLPEPYGTAASAFALFYGVPTWGFAMLWISLATAITVRTSRQGLPFALTWWSFTFPVGTVSTGTSALAVRTGSTVLEVAAVLLFLALTTAWVTVAIRTTRGIWRGNLLRPVVQPGV